MFDVGDKLTAMKQTEYTEGPKALEHFEQGMTALFKVPKTAVLRKKKKQSKQTATSRKPKNSDKD